MSDYTPSEVEIIEGATVSEDERRRGIARIRADALREAADSLEHMTTGPLGDDGEEWVRVRDLYGRADLIEEGEL